MCIDRRWFFFDRVCRSVILLLSSKRFPCHVAMTIDLNNASTNALFSKYKSGKPSIDTQQQQQNILFFASTDGYSVSLCSMMWLRCSAWFQRNLQLAACTSYQACTATVFISAAMPNIFPMFWPLPKHISNMDRSLDPFGFHFVTVSVTKHKHCRFFAQHSSTMSPPWGTRKIRVEHIEAMVRQTTNT